MTYETKYLIDLNDILGVELACHACKGRILLGHDAEKKMFTACPLCNEEWLDNFTQEEMNIRQFVNLLRTADDILKGRKFTMRLQIAKPPDVEAKR